MGLTHAGITHRVFILAIVSAGISDFMEENLYGQVSYGSTILRGLKNILVSNGVCYGYASYCNAGVLLSVFIDENGIVFIKITKTAILRCPINYMQWTNKK